MTDIRVLEMTVEERMRYLSRTGLLLMIPEFGDEKINEICKRYREAEA